MDKIKTTKHQMTIGKGTGNINDTNVPQLRAEFKHLVTERIRTQIAGGDITSEAFKDEMKNRCAYFWSKFPGLFKETLEFPDINKFMGNILKVLNNIELVQQGKMSEDASRKAADEIAYKTLLPPEIQKTFRNTSQEQIDSVLSKMREQDARPRVVIKDDQ